ncbi:polysaccharide export outer membrane protein [Rhodoblastus acidophilus]|uniref:SLBB domain-containing protein n=1 Tax=Rhodoblastus acidophilus TaxID=1074 RepID=UPI0022246BC7|nr:SLBB domain-containing protein [Rhodoblastus acidophilus]MCW2283839.1 polysaccharide export outer membrane protein [Rhodoblastus acidophilus]MCW2332535.1 polysaccharide export outer membrane protein [Rhodoblastus acidophilus]
MKSRPLLLVLTILLALVCGADVARAAESGGRTLTTNDVVQVGVLGQPDFSASARVEPDGTLALSYVGRLRAAGRTTGALAAQIAALLRDKGLVKAAQVSVEVQSFGLQVSVLGEVREPGAFTLDRPITLAQALARAGGLQEDAAESTLVVHRGSRVLRFSARAVLEGREGAKILLANNDTLFVEQGRIIYVTGYVNKPGQFALNRPGLTIRQAIALAGGLTPLGSDGWGLKLRRAGVEYAADIDQPVEADDTVIVNERLF